MALKIKLSDQNFSLKKVYNPTTTQSTFVLSATAPYEICLGEQCAQEVEVTLQKGQRKVLALQLDGNVKIIEDTFIERNGQMICTGRVQNVNFRFIVT